MSNPNPAEALVQRILQGNAPLPLRQAAARGALPLPRPALTRLYVHLLNDPEDLVRRDAKASLDAFGAAAVGEVLSDPSCSTEVLRHFAPKAARDANLAERVAFHPEVPDDVLITLAGEGNSAVIDLVLTNQQKLLSSPNLLDRLTMNPALRPDQRGRILDMLDRLAKSEEAPDAPLDVQSAPALAGADAVELAARLLEVDVGELYAASEILGGEELEVAEDPVVRSTYRRILTLSAAQKAMLAMKGGREERIILVRDTNKVVALSVLKNPRLTEGDVEEIALMRNVSEEVLRSVGASREWSKRYHVAVALVRNPRTPPGISMNFISRLTAQDLKALVKDKNVPELVRRVAKKTYELRTQQTSTTYRKK